MRATLAACALLGAATALGSTTAAAGHAVFGTEDLPELVDSRDDVQYHDLYTGPRDHAYLDALAVWFEYLPDRDAVRMTLKVEDASGLRFPPDGWTLLCSVYGDVQANDQTMGRIGYFWTKAADENTIRSGVSWDATGSNARVGSLPSIRHEFEARFEKPGYFEFRVSRAQLLQFGDLVANPHVTCYESFDPAANGGILINNGDSGESAGAYSVRDLRRARAPDGELDPIEALGPNPPTGSDEPPEQGSDSIAAIGFVAAATAVAAAAIASRRHRR